MARPGKRTWTMVFAIAYALTQASRGAPEDDARIAKAREMLVLWSTGKSEELSARGTERLRKVVVPNQLAMAWAGLEHTHGKYVGEESAEIVASSPVVGVRFTLKFERAIARVRITLSEKDELAGLQVEEAKPISVGGSPPYAQAGKFREVPVALESGGFEMRAILTTPEGKDVMAGVVLVHGSGPHDADETTGPNRPFRDLAQGLAAKGVASLRYDKRTLKHATAVRPEEITLEWETIDDAIAAVRLLRGRPELRGKKVFVLGHSLGGMAAPLIAQREGDLAGVILMAANARPIVDLIEDQLSYIASLGGNEGDQARAALEQARPVIAAIREKKEGDGKALLLGVPSSYWADISRRDVLGAADALNVPILVIHGGRDYQVTKKDLGLWKSRLEGKSSVSFKVYERLNHCMIAGEAPSTPADDQRPGFVDEAVIGDIAAWLAR